MQISGRLTGLGNRTGHGATRWAAAATLLLAAAVRLPGLGNQSLWFDEAWSAYAAGRPSLAAAAAADPTNPPLYYLILHLFALGAGQTEFALRCFSAFVGLLVVALCGRLAWREAGPRAGRYALLAAATAPLLWWASGEARMYGMMAALAVVAALAWRRLRTSRRAGLPTWAALAAAEVGLLYTHNTGPVAVAWLNAATLLGWIADRRTGRPSLPAWLVAQTGVVVLWAPWLGARFAGLRQANSVLQVSPEPVSVLVAHAWSGYWAGTWSAVSEPAFAVLGRTWPYVGVAGLGLLPLAAALRHRSAARPLLHVLLLAAGMAFGTWFLGVPLNGRYLVVAAPFVAVLLGIGTSTWRRWPRAAGAAGLVAALLVALSFAGRPKYGRDDVRAVAEQYALGLGPADTVLAWSYADRYDLAYYWPREAVTARRVTVPEGTDWPKLPAYIPADGRVAVNVWHTQRADQRGALPCLLGHGALAPAEVWDQRHMTTLVFDEPPTETPRQQPIDVRWAPARLVAAPDIGGGWPADRSVCMPLRFLVQGDLGVDLKARVEARNEVGMAVAREDVMLADAAGRTTSALTAEAVVEGFALLRLPAGAPGGRYQVTVRLYDERRLPWGYDPESASEFGRDVPVADWDVAPAQAALAAVTTDLVPAAGPSSGHRRLVAASVPASVPDSVAASVAATVAATAAATAAASEGADVRPGDTVDLTLAWSGSGPLPDLRLMGPGDAWAVPLQRHEGSVGTITRDWLRVRVPAQAGSGTAEVRTPENGVVARLTIAAPPRLDRAPPIQTPLDVAFPGLGRLVGASVEPAAVSPGQTVTVTLVWQALAATDKPLAVFVHLADDAGRPAGQSDSPPGQGTRPTTGWRVGEYVVDPHPIQLPPDVRGRTTMEVGAYDPTNGQRWPVAGSTDRSVPVSPGPVVR